MSTCKDAGKFLTFKTMKNIFKSILLFFIFSFSSCQEDATFFEQAIKIDEFSSPEKILLDKDLIQFFDITTDLILDYNDDLQQLNSKDKISKIEKDKYILLNSKNNTVNEVGFSEIFRKSIEKNKNKKRDFDQIHIKVKNKYSIEFFNSSNFKKAAEIYLIRKENQSSKSRVKGDCSVSKTNCGRYVFITSLVCVAASGGSATLWCVIGAAAGYDYCTAEYNNCMNQQ
jgi:hypothetical protein